MRSEKRYLLQRRRNAKAQSRTCSKAWGGRRSRRFPAQRRNRDGPAGLRDLRPASLAKANPGAGPGLPFPGIASASRRTTAGRRVHRVAGSGIASGRRTGWPQSVAGRFRMAIADRRRKSIYQKALSGPLVATTRLPATAVAGGIAGYGEAGSSRRKWRWRSRPSPEPARSAGGTSRARDRWPG